MDDVRQATRVVRTVLGDLPSEALGTCDYHEHLFQATPLLPGDELDDEGLSTAEAVTLRHAGVDAMIEATPTGLGRDPAAVARASANSGPSVVHVSGAHRDEHYSGGHWLLTCTESDLLGRFRAEGRPRRLPRERRASAQRVGALTISVAGNAPVERSGTVNRSASAGRAGWSASADAIPKSGLVSGS